ncbi:MAG: hypothetical protein U0R50_13015 [Gaiellales bacterium]
MVDQDERARSKRITRDWARDLGLMWVAVAVFLLIIGEWLYALGACGVAALALLTFGLQSRK